MAMRIGLGGLGVRICVVGGLIIGLRVGGVVMIIAMGCRGLEGVVRMRMGV
jgi:hypothetical protein